MGPHNSITSNGKLFSGCMPTSFEHSFSHPVRVLVEQPDAQPPARGWPVVLALHGMGEDAADMHAKLAAAGAFGNHLWLIPDGPLPFERRSTRAVGRAWYLFAGDQGLLARTMEHASAFLLGVLDSAAASRRIDAGRVTLLGFSQGGYLASVLAGRNQQRFRGAACVGGRLKHELFLPAASAPPEFLQIHGSTDSSVTPELAQNAVAATKALGFEVGMKIIDGAGHDLTPEMVREFLQWHARL